jgi:hypothetical protein
LATCTAEEVRLVEATVSRIVSTSPAMVHYGGETPHPQIIVIIWPLTSASMHGSMDLKFAK